MLARVDGLAEAPRTLLQVAAVIGHRFSADLLRISYGESDDTFAQCLEELEAHALLVRQETEGRVTYHFTHVLIQDTLYSTLLTPRREALHQRVGEAIERSYPAHLSEWVDVLARHWCRTARVDKAVHYLALAGEKNLRVYALVEAHACFRQAVERIETAPPGAYDTVLADVLLHWARVHYYQKDFKGLIAVVEPYWARLTALGDRRRLSLLCFWLGFAYAIGAHCATAECLLERALTLGEAIDDAECIGYACMGLMWCYAYWRQGDAHACDRVDELGQRSLAIATRLHDVYLASKCLLCFVLHRGTYSRFQEARTTCAQLLALGEEARDPRTTAMGLWALAFVDVMEERFEEAIARAEEAWRLSPDLLDRLTAQGIKGVALILRDRGQNGKAILQELREARQELVAGEYLLPLASFDIPYGAAMVLTGQMAIGVHWIEKAIQRCGALGAATQYPFGHLILGEIYLQMTLGQAKLPFRLLRQNLGFLLRTLPHAARKAHYHLDEAIRRARALEMPDILARALLDLSMFYQARKRMAEARVSLEEARDITERWASPSLQAKICAALASLDDPDSP